MPATTRKTSARISDDAVKARTGRPWPEWFAILDRAGARKMPHKEIVHYLSSEHKVPDWWSQMVTVTYEQERGMRELHQTAQGYQLGASKTVASPIERLYQAWADPKLRRQWLPEEPLEVTSSTPSKSVRGKWNGGKSRLDANFYPKGPGESYVSLSHTRLQGNAEVERTRVYWTVALERLKKLVEG